MSPRDFLAGDDSISQTQDYSPRDFLQEFSHKKEGLGEAAIKAPFRIGEDVFIGAFNTLKKVPQYYQSAKTEFPAALETLLNNPSRAANQGLAGIAELGQNIFNAPHDITNYASQRLNLIPQEFNEKVQMAKMPSDTNAMINQLFGEEKQAGDKLIRGGARNILNIMAGGKAASVLNPMNLTAGNIAKDVIKTGQKNRDIFSKKYEKLWQEASKKGFNDLSPVAQSIDMTTLKKFSPKKSIASVEDFIANPSLKTAHAAKSDLLRIKRDLEKLTTMRGAERKQYKAATDAINDIERNMFKDAKGNVDKKMLGKYNAIQKGYANEVVPYKNKSIGKFKRNEISARELVNAISHGEFMAKRGGSHKALGIRKKIIPVGGTIGGLGLLKFLYDNMLGNGKESG